MTNARGHNIKKMKKKKRKRKMIRGEGKYPVRHFVCFELNTSFLTYLMFN
jgi:hypothetical protein